LPLSSFGCGWELKPEIESLHSIPSHSICVQRTWHLPCRGLPGRLPPSGSPKQKSTKHQYPQSWSIEFGRLASVLRPAPIRVLVSSCLGASLHCADSLTGLAVDGRTHSRQPSSHDVLWYNSIAQHRNMRGTRGNVQCYPCSAGVPASGCTSLVSGVMAQMLCAAATAGLWKL
jgi:hypothetical protein